MNESTTNRFLSRFYVDWWYFCRNLMMQCAASGQKLSYEANFQMFSYYSKCTSETHLKTKYSQKLASRVFYIQIFSQSILRALFAMFPRSFYVWRNFRTSLQRFEVLKFMIFYFTIENDTILQYFGFQNFKPL